MDLAFRVAVVVNAISQDSKWVKWINGVRLGLGNLGCHVKFIEGKIVEDIIQDLREFSPMILILDHELTSLDGAIIAAALPEDLDLPRERRIGTSATIPQDYCFRSFSDLNISKDDLILREDENPTRSARFESVARRLWDGIETCQDEYWKLH